MRNHNVMLPFAPPSMRPLEKTVVRPYLSFGLWAYNLQMTAFLAHHSQLTLCQGTKPLRGMGASIPRLMLILSVLVVDW